METTEFRGDLETHLTVCLTAEADLSHLQQWAAEHDLKCVHILLERGDTPSQPMLTGRERGCLSRTLAHAQRTAQALHRSGFTVTRLKIEAAPGNEGIPQTAQEAVQHSAERYFEHHIKLLLPPETDCAELRTIALQHTAHLSRNALKVRGDGYLERFVTQRCYGVGRPEAQARCTALVQELASLAYPILDTEEEFVVYDSNLALDAGWIGEFAQASQEVTQ